MADGCQKRRVSLLRTEYGRTPVAAGSAFVMVGASRPQAPRQARAWCRGPPGPEREGPSRNGIPSDDKGNVVKNGRGYVPQFLFLTHKWLPAPIWGSTKIWIASRMSCECVIYDYFSTLRKESDGPNLKERGNGWKCEENPGWALFSIFFFFYVCLLLCKLMLISLTKGFLGIV